MLDAFKGKKEPWPHSHYDLIEYYYEKYERDISTGEFQPFLYPWGTIGAAVVIAYLLIPHQNRPWLKNGRYLAFAWITAFAIYTILYTRAKGMAPSFGTGLISAWSVAWCLAILVCNDAQTDFQRIERLEGFFGSSNTTRVEEKGENIDTDKQQNGNTKASAGPRHRYGSFAWQPYPLTPVIERIDWVLDVFCNFRGTGWNWRPSALPPPPKSIQEALHANASSSPVPPPKTSVRIHSSQLHAYPSRRALLRANLRTFIIGYISLDALKTLLMHDPYFWGLISRPPPSYLPYSSNPILTHTIRLLLSMLAIKSALQTIFSLGPLFFGFTLGPDFLGARAEHWMYPESWGSYTVVLDEGLAGWWGAWWHQTFRFAFQEPGRKIVEHMGWDRKSTKARATQLGLAFAMSGGVHASGSWTCWGETRPVRGPMAFFLLQAVGVFVEGAASEIVGKRDGMPRWARRACTFVYVHVWFYFTAHLLCDDFARGGIWLFEPIPVSVLRGLGFGADPRDGLWCWTNVTKVVRWHRGDSWWTTGIGF